MAARGALVAPLESSIAARGELPDSWNTSDMFQAEFGAFFEVRAQNGHFGKEPTSRAACKLDQMLLRAL